MDHNEAAQTANPAESRRMVTFIVGTEEYGVPILSVREIVRMMHITTVPDSPEDIRGIVNLRGSVIPIVDLRCRFRMQSHEAPDDQRIIVLELTDHTVGFIVDSVGQVLNADSGQIDPPPETTANASAAFIDGIVKLEDRLVILLDPGKLIAGETLDKVARAAPAAA